MCFRNECPELASAICRFLYKYKYKYLSPLASDQHASLTAFQISRAYCSCWGRRQDQDYDPVKICIFLLANRERYTKIRNEDTRRYARKFTYTKCDVRKASTGATSSLTKIFLISGNVSIVLLYWYISCCIALYRAIWICPGSVPFLRVFGRGRVGWG